MKTKRQTTERITTKHIYLKIEGKPRKPVRTVMAEDILEDISIQVA